MTHFAAIAASALVTAIWQGALLAAAVALCLRALPGLSAAVRSALWTSVFAIIVLLHFVPAHAGSSASPEIHAAPLLSFAIVCLWLVLATFRAIQFSLSALRLRQVARRAEPVAATPQAPQIARKYTLCVSPDVDRPSVLGFWNPRVLLPPGLVEKLSASELQQVLLHETEHLRRSDDWTNLLQKLALVVFPLNPALFWVERRLCLERELACDDRVLLATGARKAYATCLTQLAEHGLVHRGLALALGAFSRQSELARRVHRILRSPAGSLSPAKTRVAAAAVLACVLAATGTLVRTPRLVSFSPVATELAQQRAPMDLGSAPARAGAGYPQLVKAILPPAQGAHHPLPRLMAAHRRVVAKQPPAVTSVRVQDPPRVMTIRWRYEQVQPVYLPAVYRAPAYAAVATPDGWIIFQL